MRRLHPKTLEGLAELVCADREQHYRSGAEITAFLNRADLVFPAHDGQTTRKTWVLQQLHQCNDDGEDDFAKLSLSSLKAVILQLANPREYQGDPDRIQAILTRLNRLMSAEGMLVTLEGATPRLQEVQDHVVSTDAPGIQYLVPDFNQLTSDKVLANNLRQRWEEAQRCLTANAYLATVLLLGSILEGVLLVVIQANPAEANKSVKSPKDTNGKPRSFREWSLNDYIEVTCDCGWLQGDRLRFSHALRESRNLIHPMQQRMVGGWPNENSCRICWEVVNAAIADLLKHVTSEKTST